MFRVSIINSWGDEVGGEVVHGLIAARKAAMSAAGLLEPGESVRITEV